MSLKTYLPFKTYLKKPGQTLELSKKIHEITPAEMHLFPTGSPTEKPSLAILLTDNIGLPYGFAQLSVEEIFKGMTPESLRVIENEWKRLAKERPW